MSTIYERINKAAEETDAWLTEQRRKDAALMPTTRLQYVNDIGLKIVGAENARLQSFGVWVDGGSLQVWVSVRGLDIEVMQYLTPGEAMAFAKAFERCAIAALKEQA